MACRNSRRLVILSLYHRNPDIDHEVRWCLLKLADLLIRPVEESPPSVKIHIPSTPVIESAPPPLPTVKVTVPHKPRIIKPGLAGVAKSPLIPSQPSAPKLKLPAHPHVDVTTSPKVASTFNEQPKKAVVFAKPELPAKVKQKSKAAHQPPRTPQRDSEKSHEKSAHVPKAQSGGMPLNDLRACRNMLKKLKANKHAVIFLQPVDPVRDHAPK